MTDGWHPVDPQQEPTFDLDPDPALWVVGPDASRPFESWLPGATEVVLAGRDDAGELREYVERVLTLTATANPTGLPYVMLHWPRLEAAALPLYLGLSTVEDPQQTEDWLGAAEESTVERPIVVELPGATGHRLRRAVVYAVGPDGDLTAGVRLVVDSALAPGLAVVAIAATDDPGELMAVLAACDTLMGTVTIQLPGQAAPALRREVS